MFRRVLIASGPTMEPIDPVRYISNRSSGLTGFYIAQEAKKHCSEDIVFVTGPTRYLPEGINLHKVETAMQMRQKLLEFYAEAEVVIMAAAVADYRVSNYSADKLKKKDDVIFLELKKNPDILSELGNSKKHGQILVGFAAETSDSKKNALVKFRKKKLDMIVLNSISKENPAFEVEENRVSFITEEGIMDFNRLTKAEISVNIWNEIEKIAERIKHR